MHSIKQRVIISIIIISLLTPIFILFAWHNISSQSGNTKEMYNYAKAVYNNISFNIENQIQLWNNVSTPIISYVDNIDSNSLKDGIDKWGKPPYSYTQFVEYYKQLINKEVIESSTSTTATSTTNTNALIIYPPEQFSDDFVSFVYVMITYNQLTNYKTYLSTLGLTKYDIQVKNTAFIGKQISDQDGTHFSIQNNKLIATIIKSFKDKKIRLQFQRDINNLIPKEFRNKISFSNKIPQGEKILQKDDILIIKSNGKYQAIQGLKLNNDKNILYFTIELPFTSSSNIHFPTKLFIIFLIFLLIIDIFLIYFSVIMPFRKINKIKVFATAVSEGDLNNQTLENEDFDDEIQILVNAIKEISSSLQDLIITLARQTHEIHKKSKEAEDFSNIVNNVIEELNDISEGLSKMTYSQAEEVYKEHNNIVAIKDELYNLASELLILTNQIKEEDIASEYLYRKVREKEKELRDIGLTNDDIQHLYNRLTTNYSEEVKNQFNRIVTSLMELDQKLNKVADSIEHIATLSEEYNATTETISSNAKFLKDQSIKLNEVIKGLNKIVADFVNTVEKYHI